MEQKPMNNVKENSKKKTEADEDLSCVKIILTYAYDLFHLRNEDFDRLEVKATALIALGGILVTLDAFSIDKFLVFSSSNLHFTSKLIFPLFFVGYVTHIVSLILTFWFALNALKIRKMSYPASVNKVVQKYRDLSRKNNQQRRLIKSIILLFSDVEADLNQKTLIKAENVRKSMFSLLTAVLSMLILGFLCAVFK